MPNSNETLSLGNKIVAALMAGLLITCIIGILLGPSQADVDRNERDISDNSASLSDIKEMIGRMDERMKRIEEDVKWTRNRIEKGE